MLPVNENIFPKFEFMKKKLTLLIFLMPVVIFAQTQYNKDGTITIDFGKKNKQKQDTVQPKPAKVQEEEPEEEAPKPKKERKQNTSVNSANGNQKDDFNWKRDGLFKGLIHIGLNACQIDGDSY